MLKGRDKIQILGDMLNSCKDGATLTHIRSKANLNYRVAREHLKLLIEKGLLSEMNGLERRYRPTEKGRQFLEIFNKIKALIGKKE